MTGDDYSRTDRRFYRDKQPIDDLRYPNFNTLLVILITFRVIASGDDGSGDGSENTAKRDLEAASTKLARHRYNIRTDASRPASAGNQTRCRLPLTRFTN